MTGFVGVHIGAGHHSCSLQGKYEQLCKKASKKGVDVLLSGGSALDAVTMTTQLLENSVLTNAGYGSNLTWDGKVECDASVMDGTSLQFGAVGAAPRIKNPVALAHMICKKQLEPLPLGRVQPCLLVGTGASEWASQNGIDLVDEDYLISERAWKQYNHYKRKLVRYQALSLQETELLDTVGAICVDSQGRTAAASSSGGIVLKHSGRVGQAATYGGGCWAENGRRNEGIPSVAVSTSGCGEHIIKTCLARESARALQSTNCPTVAINQTLTNMFLKSPFLKDVKEKLCGITALQYSMEGAGVEYLWAHTTQSMCIGYMSTNHTKPSSRMSRLPEGRIAGSTVIVEGVFC